MPDQTPVNMLLDCDTGVLVAVGPLTNVALALALCPELPALPRGVAITGGAALVDLLVQAGDAANDVTPAVPR
jgi:inosine-uridine nucleoside N-ribohydrolase